MLNNEYPPLGGGTATVNREILRSLSADSNLEIDLITGCVGPAEEIERLSDTIRIIRLPLSSSCLHHATSRELLRYARLALVRAIREHRTRRYDLCFAWCSVPAGAVALVLRLFCRLPYIVRVSGPDIPGYERRHRFIYPFVSPVIRSVWRWSRTVVVKSAHESKLVSTESLQSKLTVIPNGVDANFFHPTPAVRSAGSPLRLVSVGRLVGIKRHDLTIRAIRQLKDSGVRANLTLVGTGDDELRLRELTRTLNLEADVSFVGYVPREALLPHYQNADLFVLASENEGMSVALLEAMACGLPVVAARGCGSDEFIGEGGRGALFDATSDTGLSDALRSYAIDPRRLLQHGEQARLYAASLSWAAVSDQYRRLFELVDS